MPILFTRSWALHPARIPCPQSSARKSSQQAALLSRWMTLPGKTVLSVQLRVV
jgi:hypothetical protein